MRVWAGIPTGLGKRELEATVKNIIRWCPLPLPTTPLQLVSVELVCVSAATEPEMARRCTAAGADWGELGRLGCDAVLGMALMGRCVRLARRLPTALGMPLVPKEAWRAEEEMSDSVESSETPLLEILD